MKRKGPSIGDQGWFWGFEVKAVETSNRILQVVVTTTALDREREAFDLQGMKLDTYRKNPVVLWFHRISDPPIGKCLDIQVQGETLPASIQFAGTEFATEIFQLYSGGFCRAWSPGFITQKAQLINPRDPMGGQRILECELVEISACPIGVNPESLTKARGEKAIGASTYEKLKAMIRPTPKLERRVLLRVGETDGVWTRDGSRATLASKALAKSFSERAMSGRIPVFIMDVQPGVDAGTYLTCGAIQVDEGGLVTEARVDGAVIVMPEGKAVGSEKPPEPAPPLPSATPGPVEDNGLEHLRREVQRHQSDVRVREVALREVLP